MKQITLLTVKKSDYRFLYYLLKQRDADENISHKKTPSYREHLNFIASKPYSKWYIIYFDNEKIGSAYLSKINEIGIHLKKEFKKKKLKKNIIKILIKKNPRSRYLFNLSSKNKNYLNFLKKNKLKLIQYTFEMDAKQRINF